MLHMNWTFDTSHWLFPHMNADFHMGNLHCLCVSYSTYVNTALVFSVLETQKENLQHLPNSTLHYLCMKYRSIDCSKHIASTC